MNKLYAVPTSSALAPSGESASSAGHKRRLLTKPLQQSVQAPVVLPGIQLQILFETGQDELTERARITVNMLADLLLAYPQLLVRLEGHTDSRGTDEYNNVLSDYRARSVEDCLLSAGVELARIERSACGSSRARAARGDQRGYTLERRVNIEVYRACENGPDTAPIH